MAFASSSFPGLPQSIGSETAEGGISALCTGGCWLRTEWKCSTHRFICSSGVFSALPFLSFIGWLPFLNLFVRDLITSYRTLMLFCLAASSASDVKVVMKVLLSFLALFLPPYQPACIRGVHFILLLSLYCCKEFFFNFLLLSTLIRMSWDIHSLYSIVLRPTVISQADVSVVFTSSQ